MFLLRSNAEDGALAVAMLFYFLFFLLFFAMGIVLLVSMWKIFVKAGEEGWKCLIPVYRTYIMTVKIAGKDDTTFILHLLPFVNIYASIVTNMALAKSFGKDDGYGLGLTFLGIVFFPMLGFGSAQYVGPGGVPVNPVPPTNVPTTDWQNNSPTPPPQV